MTPKQMYNLAMQVRAKIMASHLERLDNDSNIHKSVIVSFTHKFIDYKTTNIHAWFKQN